MSERPLCKCHEEPMLWKKDKRCRGGGWWKCRIKHNTYSRALYHRRYHSDPEYRKKVIDTTRKWQSENPEWCQQYESKRVRIRAGGFIFHLGTAPTAEDAAHLREKIKKEAPRAA